jgi:hypothetical protein
MLSSRVAFAIATGFVCPLFVRAQNPPPKLVVLAPAAAGAPVRFSFAAPPGTVWALVFYRAVGEEEFRSLPLRPESGGLVATLPTGEIGGRAIQYYLAFKGATGVMYLPEDAPTSLEGLDLGPAGAGPNATAQIKHKLPFQVEASLEKVFYRSQKVEGERTFIDSGQVALGYELEAGEHHLRLNTRLAYQNQPMEGQSAWSVGELHGQYAYRNHRAQIGDMAFQESEFTVGGMGRRGMDYLYDDHRLYAHFFAVGTEQLAGFRGLAWPVKGTELFGGAVGWAWLDGRVKSKLVFLTGRDDPSQGVNVGAASFVTRREGSTAALTLEAALLENRLSLNGEYARTNYDKDLDDAYGKVQDQAWRVGGAWSEKTYSARASYRQIGRDFGTLGYPVMEGDRRGFDGGFSLNLNPSWSLNASATSERNNPNADPLETRARNDAQTLDAQWTLRPGLTMRAGLNRGEQEAGASGSLVPFANSRRSGVNAGLDWAPMATAALSCSAQFDKLEGTGASTSTGRSATLTFGGAFQVPNHLRLAPTLSYSKNTEDGTGQDSKVINAFLNADVTLVQKWLSLALNGGYNRTDASGMAAVTSTNADAALQWFLTPYLDRSFHRGQAVLALRFRYTRVQTLPEADRRGSLTLNFSF